MSDDVVIVSAAAPRSQFQRRVRHHAGHDLGAIAIKAALERAGIEPRGFGGDHGQILTAAQGQTRPAGLDRRRIPVESPAGRQSIVRLGLRTWRWAIRRC